MQDDLKELIKTLRSHHVEFLVVGPHALALYGCPRFTEDLDLFVQRSTANEAALIAFGLSVKPESINQFMTRERQMIVLGNAPKAVDLLNFLDGVEFESAWANREPGELGGTAVDFIGGVDYVRTKLASGQPKDLRDLDILAELG